MKTKKVRPKLVFGNYKCVQEWVHRAAVSDDPDNDPNLLVRSSETGGNIFPIHNRDRSLNWRYTSMHPTTDIVRKIESHGRKLYSYGSFFVAKLLGQKDRSFWLINSKDSDSMSSRTRSDLFRVLTQRFVPNTASVTRTDQFAFVPEHLLDVTAEQIKDRWDEYLSMYRKRIEDIGNNFNPWVAEYHSDLALRTVAKEYGTLGKYVGVHAVGAYHLESSIMVAKEKLTAAAVLKKLKEK